MLNKFKAFLFKLGVGERRTLIKHEQILKDIDKATLISRLTIEEYVKLRGFPYSSLHKKTAHVKG
jgi:hypothetical protein